MKYNIVGIYEATIEADNLDEAINKLMMMKLDTLDNVYVSDYDYE